MRSRWIPRGMLLLALALLVVSASSAEPVVEGIPNFHQVNARLYRGGQPLPGAWPALATLGVTTVIDLRLEREHSTAAEARAVEAAGMRYVGFPLNGSATPDAAQIAEVLGLIEAGDTVFVHCKLGMDRTGMVVAAYRLRHEHWANQQALDEAEALGMHWYSAGMKRFILDYRPSATPPAGLPPASDTTATPVAEPAVPAR